MNNHRFYIRFLPLLAGLFFLMQSTFAGNGLVATGDWSGTQIEANSTIDFFDNMWGATGGITANSFSSLFEDRMQRAWLELAIDPNIQQPNNWEAEIELTVDYNSFDPNANWAPINPRPSETFTLRVSYDAEAGVNIQAGSYYVMEYAYDLDITVNTLNVIIDGVGQQTAPDFLVLNGYIEAERYWDFDRSLAPTLNTLQIDAVNQVINVSWDFIQSGYPTAEFYELEWTFVDDYEDTPNNFITDLNELEYDFRHNSTRINLTEPSYQIPLLFEHGYLIARVRAVGRMMPNPEQVQTGKWSIDEDQGTLQSLAGSGILPITDVHREDFNWSYTATYAENALKKEVVTYADARLAGRQTVTKINSEEQVVAQENVLDALGRPAINVLPVPLQSSVLDFQPNLNQNAAGAPYSWEDFDAGDCNDTETAPMSSNAGANRYYSSSNPDQADQQAYVPEAHGYAFSQTEFTDDMTGRPRRQGGVGPEFQLTDHTNNPAAEQHFTSYYYSDADQEDLEDLFGPFDDPNQTTKNVGNAVRYRKNMVVDPMGQASITYVDEHGRTIATALAGASPAQLDPLSSNTANTTKTREYIQGKNNNKKQGDGWVFDRQITIETAGDYIIDYSLTTASFQETCDYEDPNNASNTLQQEICFDCVYDFTFEIIDDCGQPLFTDSKLIEPTTVQSICNSGDPNAIIHSINTTLSFDKATQISIVKKLSVHQPTALDLIAQYTDPAINPCAKTQEYFLDLYINDIDLSDCNGEDYCLYSCKMELGEFEDYQEANPNASQADYDAALAACTTACEQIDNNYCSLLYERMIADISPGGQYAQFDIDPATGNYDANDYEYSLLNINTSLGGTNLPGGLNLEYIGPGTGPYHYKSAAVTYPPGPVDPKSISLNEFVDGFTREWAEALVTLHPEYCFYTWCMEMEESRAFDLDLHAILTAEEANNEFNNDPFNLMDDDPFFINNGPGTSSNLVPFFDGTGNGTPSAAMIHFLTKFQSNPNISNSYYSLIQVVHAITNCSPKPANLNDLNACITANPWPDPINPFPEAFECTSDEEWNLFKILYISEKARIAQLLEKELVCYGIDIPNKDEISPESEDLLPGLDLSADLNTIYNKAHDIVNDPNGNGTGIPTSCETQCAGYRTYWASKLEACSGPGSALNATQLEEVLDLFEKICSGGCGGQYPLGSQTSPDEITFQGPNGPATAKTFEQVLEAYGIFSDPTHSQFNPECNVLLIQMPPLPNVSLSGSSLTFPILDACACDAILSVNTDYANGTNVPAGINSPDELFIYRYGDVMPNFQSRVCDCNEAWAKDYSSAWNPTEAWGPIAKEYLDELEQYIPGDIACKKCISCAVLAPVYDNYANIFAGYENGEILLEAQLNAHFGFSLEIGQYESFMQDCELATQSTCTPQTQMEDLVALLNALSNPTNHLLTDQGIDLTQITGFNYVGSDLYPNPPGPGCSPTMDAQVLFSRLFNADIFHFALTSDGGQLLVGKLNGTTGSELLLARQASDDTWTWIQQLNWGSLNPQIDEASIQVLQTQDGGFLLSMIASDPGFSANEEILLAKVDGSGNFLWAELIEDSEAPARITGVVELSGGDIVVGYANGGITGQWSYETVLFRYNPITHQLVWQRTFEDLGDPLFANNPSLPTQEHLVGTDNDMLYVGGMSDVQDGLGIVAMDQNGSVLAGEVYSDFTKYCTDNSFALSPTTTGDLAVMVQTADDIIQNQANLFRLSLSGNTFNTDWNRLYRWGKGFTFRPHSLEPSLNDGLVLAGIFEGGSYDGKASLIKIKSNGIDSWQRIQASPQQTSVWAVQKDVDHFMMLSSEARLENLIGWPGLDVIPKGVCSEGLYETFVQTGSLSAPLPYAISPLTTLTLSLDAGVQSPATPPSTSIPATLPSVYPQCEEILLVHLYDGCDQDCRAMINLPASQGAHFTQVNQIHSEVLGSISTFTATVDYLDHQGQPQQQQVDGYNSCQGNCDFELVLCNEPFFESFTMIENPCETYLTDLATHYAKEAYDKYKDDLGANFLINYRNQCLDQTNLNESLTITFPQNNYHYTLYYYDQAGNLVQTVPPAGVSTDGSGDHEKVTEYRYNSLNQLVWQNTPDGGESKFWYDHLGRIIFSQNAEQATEGRYSYTKFDDLGRTVEGGEVDYSDPSGILSTAFDTRGSLLQDGEYEQIWASIGNLTPTSQNYHEVTQTVYDAAIANPPQELLDAFDGGQQHLYNRVAATLYLDVDDPLRNVIQHYSYDVHGNVHTMVTEIPSLDHLEHRYKRFTYEYDLLSGAVQEVHYQHGEADQFHHKYAYDDDNRIVEVQTSKDGISWDTDVAYSYYQHGPLARVELGEDRVQGVDYAYTLQGWIKAINGNMLEPYRDMGKDNTPLGGGPYNLNHDRVARDAFGFSIGYFQGDYTPIATPAMGAEFLASVDAHYGNGNFIELFNGNINHLTSSLRNPDGNYSPQVTAYRYDQLQRITQQTAFTDFTNVNGHDWSSITSIGDYQTNYSYDADGNLQTLMRNGFTASGNQAMDDFNYVYYSDGNGTPTNRLAYVEDNVPENNYTLDLDGQDPNNMYPAQPQIGLDETNYLYDQIGNLTQDKAEEIFEITWTVSGKIREIIHNDGFNDPNEPDSDKPDLEFGYTPDGNRLYKIVKPDPKDESTWTYTYYMRDAQGNVLATYSRDYAQTAAANTDAITFVADDMQAYAGDQGTAEVLGDGSALKLNKGARKAFEINYSLTASTVLEFEFKTDAEGDAHAIGFDNNLNLSWDKQYMLYGSSPPASVQTTWPGSESYDPPGAWKRYRIPLSSGSLNGPDGKYLIFTNDDAGTSENPVYFRNVKVYELAPGAGDDYTETLRLDEYHLYGSKRLGIQQENRMLVSMDFTGTVNPTTGLFDTKNGAVLNYPAALPADEGIAFIRGTKSYELSEHRGNVMAVISDRKLQVADANLPAGFYFEADIRSTKDYYAFGMEMPGRGWSRSGEGYRFAFNGMEKDDEISGTGNSYTTHFRQYDPRIGRWMSLDPAMKKYPGHSPYAAFNNNPIFFTDPFGNDPPQDDPPEGFKEYKISGATILLPDHFEVETFENDENLIYDSGIRKEAEKGDVRSFSFKDPDYVHPRTYYADFDGYTGEFNGFRDVMGNTFNIVGIPEDIATHPEFDWTAIIGPSMILAGAPIIPKGMVTQGGTVSEGTSILSHTIGKVTIKTPKVFPRKIPNVGWKWSTRAPTLSGGYGTPIRLTATTSLGRFAGRWIPWVGWGLLAYDVGEFLGTSTAEYYRFREHFVRTIFDGDYSEFSFERRLYFLRYDDAD